MSYEERQAIRDHYSAISGAYARLESIRGRQYTRPLVEKLPIQSAERILDIGTGPGIMIDALRSKAISAMIFGVDLSPKMLEHARRRTQAHVLVMDAMNLAFRDASFDAATFSFSLFHLPDPMRGLTEARRTLRPEGHLGVATFAGEGLQSRPRTIIDELLEELGTRPRGDWPTYADERTSEEDLISVVEQAGFSVLHTWTKELRFQTDRSGEELLEFRTHRIDSLAPAQAAEFRNRLAVALAELSDEDFEVVYALQNLVARR